MLWPSAPLSFGRRNGGAGWAARLGAAGFFLRTATWAPFRGFFFTGLRPAAVFLLLAGFFFAMSSSWWCNGQWRPAPHNGLCRSQPVDGRTDDAAGRAGAFSGREQPGDSRAFACRRVARDAD